MDVEFAFKNQTKRLTCERILHFSLRNVMKQCNGEMLKKVKK